MKTTREHYDILKEKISLLGVENIKLHMADLPFRSPAPKDLKKRVRWDCLHATKIKIGDGKGMEGLPLYGYLNDNHIDTALNHIMVEIGIY